MRTIFFLGTVFAIGIFVLWLLPNPDDIPEPDKPASSAPIALNPPPLPPIALTPKPLPVEPVRTRLRNVTPDYALPGPTISGTKITRLPDLVKPAPPKPPPKPIVWKRPVVQSAAILLSEETTLKISGVTPLKLDEICLAGTDQQWPCGRFARTALRRLIRGRTIECDPVPTREKTITTACRIGSQDIGEWLVEQGWAKGLAGKFDAQMEAAKDTKSGMWRASSP